VGTINFCGLADFLVIEGGALGVFSLSLEKSILERGCDFGILIWGRSDLVGEVDLEVEADTGVMGAGEAGL
jgi:hypothetical protein